MQGNVKKKTKSKSVFKKPKINKKLKIHEPETNKYKSETNKSTNSDDFYSELFYQKRRIPVYYKENEIRKVNLTCTTKYKKKEDPEEERLPVLKCTSSVIKPEKSNSFQTETCDKNTSEMYSIVFKKKPIEIFKTSDLI